MPASPAGTRLDEDSLSSRGVGPCQQRSSLPFDHASVLELADDAFAGVTEVVEPVLRRPLPVACDNCAQHPGVGLDGDVVGPAAGEAKCVREEAGVGAEFGAQTAGASG